MLYLVDLCIYSDLKQISNNFNPEKSPIWTSVTDRVIAAPVTDVMSNLPLISSFTFVETTETTKTLIYYVFY